MQILDTPEAMRALSESWRREGRIIGFVPTMGALHEGHLSLVEAARRECGVVVVSIFVNPAQFSSADDLDRYPRGEERDRRLAEEAGVRITGRLYADALSPPDGPASSYEAMFRHNVGLLVPAMRGNA